jgi:hypothetical protein
MSEQYKGKTTGATYRSKLSNVLIRIREAQKAFAKGDDLEGRRLVDRAESICSELSKHFDVSDDGLITMVGVINDEEDIKEIGEVLEAPKAIEKLTEIYEEEIVSDDVAEEYASEEKKKSRSYAFHRFDAYGKEITQKINAGLFIVHNKLMDIVQAWDEGLIDRYTQLVLVSSGSYKDENGETKKVIEEIWANFDSILEQTTKDMGYDSVPHFDNTPRYWHRSVHTLKENSKCQYNEDGTVWADLKGKIQYAFLDYCGTNNLKYMKWYEEVLYPMLGNNSNIAINHFSYVRNDVSGWRDKCYHLFGHCVSSESAIGCYTSMLESGEMGTFVDTYYDQITELSELCGNGAMAIIQLLMDTCEHIRGQGIASSFKEVSEIFPSIDFSRQLTSSEHSRLYGDERALEVYMSGRELMRDTVIMLQSQSSSKQSTELFDSELLFATFWKAGFLDRKNNNVFITTPKTSWVNAQTELVQKGKRSKPIEEIEDIDNTENYYEYVGKSSSCKMAIHKLIIAKKGISFKHNPNLPSNHLRQTSLLKNFAEQTNMAMGSLAQAMMFVDFKNVESDGWCTPTYRIDEQDGSVLMTGMSKGESQAFIQKHCVNKVGVVPATAIEPAGHQSTMVRMFTELLYSKKMNEAVDWSVETSRESCRKRNQIEDLIVTEV